MTPLLYTGAQWGTIIGLIVLGLVLKLVVIQWIRRDAAARGTNPTGWIVAAVFAELITLLVWLIARPDTLARPSPAATRSTAQAPAPHEARRVDPAAHDAYRAGFTDAESAAPAPPGDQTVTVTCPRCQHRNTVTSQPHTKTSVTCASCGAQGTI